MTTRVPISDPGRCDYLYDDSTLRGAIHLDMTGTYLQCDQPAVWEGVLPPDEAGDPDMIIALCDQHKTEAVAEGLRAVHPVHTTK
jgi:hypothetical protein